MTMTSEAKDKLFEKIHALGFTPYPFTDPKDFEINPACIQPPTDIKLDDWLSINQCEAVAQKSDRTIYRWQNTGMLINFTVLAEGKDRNNVRHYIYKNDFMGYMERELNQKVVYIYKNPLTDRAEDVLDKSTEGRQIHLSADVSGRQARQEVGLLTPEAQEKLLALPEELGKRIEAAFAAALGKQKEDLLSTIKQEVSDKLEAYTQTITKQLEYKNAESEEKDRFEKSVKQLANSFSKSKQRIFIGIVCFCIVTFGLVIFLQLRTRKERETAEKILKEEYTHKIDSLKNSQKEDLQKMHDSLQGLKDRLNIKEEGR